MIKSTEKIITEQRIFCDLCGKELKEHIAYAGRCGCGGDDIYYLSNDVQLCSICYKIAAEAGYKIIKDINSSTELETKGN